MPHPESSIQNAYHHTNSAYVYPNYAPYSAPNLQHATPNEISTPIDYYSNPSFAFRQNQQNTTSQAFYATHASLNDSVGKEIEAKSTSDENTSYDSNKENHNDDNNNRIQTSPMPGSANNSSSNTNLPAYFTTQTMYQLELLNAIYAKWKYPNSVQKTDIGRLIGITRDQVKIWFQNRRRKDTLVKSGKIPSTGLSKSQGLKRRKPTDDFESYTETGSPSSPSDEYNSNSSTSSSQKKQVVETKVIDDILNHLESHQNAPVRLSAKRTKLTDQTNHALKHSNVSQQQAGESILKPSVENRIIDLCPILNMKNSERQEEAVLSFEAKNVNPLEINVNVPCDFSTSSNNTSLGSSSLLIPTSSSSSSGSSSSSSSGSSLSSGDEEQPVYTPNQTFVKPKFQVMPQSFSIQDYVAHRYNMPQSYKMPKVNNSTTNEYHQFNQHQQQIHLSAINSNTDYQQVAPNPISKLPTWSPVDAAYQTYVEPHQHVKQIDSVTTATYEAVSQHYSYPYSMGQPEMQSQFSSHQQQAYVTTQSSFLKPQFAYQPQSAGQHYQYDNNSMLNTNANAYNYCLWSRVFFVFSACYIYFRKFINKKLV